MSQSLQPHRGYLSTIIGCYCPRCREGKLFAQPLSVRLNRIMQMNDACPVCGQPTDIEVGFYYGTSYVSYLVAIVITIISFLLWWLLIGFSYEDNRFFYWIFGNAFLLILLQPWLMRFSRSLWISFFVRYDPDWKITKPVELERVNPSEMNNW
jgi:uncharacterized protein (DUF983 family)